MNLRTFSNWRKEVSKKGKIRRNKLLFGLFVSLIIFLFLSFYSINGDRIDYSVKINGNKIDKVQFVDKDFMDNEDDIKKYLSKDKIEYIIQLRPYNTMEELDLASLKMKNNGIKNIINVSNDLARIQLVKYFTSREEAEIYAESLVKKGFFIEYEIRMK
ncbi:MAG: hypothetical protein JXM74_06875 [Fusobacteriaceae bacterium]|nr:hypothetical protein [Fusobacteriaceae bacterium]MBN2838465.1 hypothetical protein [Fusobacteriaceae bacterium]